jgi:hypothetical protein
MKFLSLFFAFLLLSAGLVTAADNETTIIINPVTTSTVGFSSQTLLWVVWIVTLIAAIILYRKIPGVAVLFGFYSLIFAFLAIPVYGFWMFVVLLGFGCAVAIPAFISVVT